MASPRIDGLEVHPSGSIGYRSHNKSHVEAVVNPASVKDWDDEELKRGMRRDKNGNFTGRPPKVVPKAIHDEQVRRLLATGQKMFRESFEGAIETLQNIAKDSTVEAKDRLKAVMYIIERVAGKTPEKIELSSGEKPFEILLNGVARDLGAEDEAEPTGAPAADEAAPDSARTVAERRTVQQERLEDLDEGVEGPATVNGTGAPSEPRAPSARRAATVRNSRASAQAASTPVERVVPAEQAELPATGEVRAGVRRRRGPAATTATSVTAAGGGPRPTTTRKPASSARTASRSWRDAPD